MVSWPPRVNLLLEKRTEIGGKGDRATLESISDLAHPYKVKGARGRTNVITSSYKNTTLQGHTRAMVSLKKIFLPSCMAYAYLFQHW